MPNLESLLGPSRGPMAPHPFYLSDSAQRADMVEFLRSLDTDSAKSIQRSVNSPSKTSGIFGWSGLFTLFTGMAVLKLRRTINQRGANK
ncbi:MAG: hypothetical protein ACR2G5_11165 [Pyrinomonadaceae bacterium]